MTTVRKLTPQIYGVTLENQAFLCSSYQLAYALAKGDINRLISHSKLATFASCRYRWDLGYNRRIGPRRDAIQLEVGKAAHKGMAVGILCEGKHCGPDVEDEITGWREDEIAKQNITPDDEAWEELNTICDDSYWIVMNALSAIDFDRYETLFLPGTALPMVELNLVCSLPAVRQAIGIRFYCDWVMKDQETGTNWLVDHKIRKQFQDDDAEYLNQQAAIYQGALHLFGVQIDGTATFQVRRKIPTEPKVLKSGELSRAYIACTWNHYQQRLLENELDPLSYEDEMIPKLAAYEWTRWSRAYRSEVEIGAVWQNVVQMAREMYGSPRLYRNMGHMNCNGCWAKEFCKAELGGLDVNFLLQTGFRRKDEPDTAPAYFEDVDLKEDE